MQSFLLPHSLDVCSLLQDMLIKLAFILLKYDLTFEKCFFQNTESIFFFLNESEVGLITSLCQIARKILFFHVIEIFEKYVLFQTAISPFFLPFFSESSGETHISLSKFKKIVFLCVFTIFPNKKSHSPNEVSPSLFAMYSKTQ